MKHVDDEMYNPNEVIEEAQNAGEIEETIDDYLLERDRLRRVIMPSQRLGYVS